MSSVFSLQGRGLKLDTRADIAPHLEGVDPTLIEEIHFGGNTLGVEASQAVADFLEKTTILKVRDAILTNNRSSFPISFWFCNSRLPILLISLLVV